MRSYIFLILFLIHSEAISTQPSEDFFNQGLNYLQKNQDKKARHSFKEYLKKNPKSLSARFNLALSFYQQSVREEQAHLKELARAYFRQVLFENPYHSPTRQALSLLKDKKYFWLWLPPDLILVFMAFSIIFLLWLFFKKKPLKLGITICLIGLAISGAYFYYRLQDHGTLMQDCAILSAPSSKASSIALAKQGSLIRILSKNRPSTKGWLAIQQESGLKAWLPSSCILPLKEL